MSGRQRSSSGPPIQMETDNQVWEKFRRSSGAQQEKKDSSEKSSEHSDQADRVNRAADALWPKNGGKTPSFFRNQQSLAHVNVPDRTRSYVPQPTDPLSKSGQPLLRPASLGQLTVSTPDTQRTTHKTRVHARNQGKGGSNTRQPSPSS